VLIDGEGGDCNLNGLYLISGTQHADHHTNIDHARPHGTSKELYKGILDGKSRAVFNGKIIVRKGAVRTDAKQTNKNLLLSDHARVNTKPQLEILADDVKCNHGATIGHLDEEALFYLKTRGMSEQNARTLLMYGFIDKKIIFIFIIAGLMLSFLSTKTRIPLIYWFLEKFERKREIEKFPGKGTVFYFIGVYLSLLLFPKDIALASIMVLAFGDSVSHMYGLHFGRTRHPLSSAKFLEGTVAGFAAGFIGALVFLPWTEAFIASLAAMIAEAIEIKIGAAQVDDNLVMPVVAGAAVWLLRLF